MFKTARRVEFGDTDMAGIVHFANFFRYMEVAETDFLMSLGTNVSFDADGTRFGFPRVSAACEYKSPARFGDLLEIAVAVEKVGTKSLTYRFEFSRDGVEIAVGRVTSVFCEKAATGMISREIPPDIRAKLQAATR